MSWYSKVIVFFLMVFSLGCGAKDIKDIQIKPHHYDKSIKINQKKDKITQADVDFFYMAALDCEFHKDYLCALKMYDNLYKYTKQKRFLKDIIRNALLSSQYSYYKKYLKEAKDLAIKDPELASYLIPYFLRTKDYKMAKDLAKNILKEEKSLKNYELLGAIYIDTKDYKKANKVLNEANKKFGCSVKICSLLLLLKAKDHDIKGMADILYKLYQTTKNKAFEVELIKLLVENKMFDELEKYIEKSKDFNKEFLLQILISAKEYQKAQKISYELYKKTKDPMFLANSAVFLYEAMAKQKKIDKKKLKEVIKRFEKSVDKVKDPTFYNYYGYLLIDHDIDIKKGLKYIKKALKYEPKNEYYLDSLAWGYYKLGQCKKAYKILKKLKDLEQEEVKAHLKKIKECLKR